MPGKKIEDLTKSKREGEKAEPPSDLPDIKYVSDRPDLLHVTDRPDIMHISDRPDVLESERRANQKKEDKTITG
jgi:hypothetical protein